MGPHIEQWDVTQAISRARAVVWPSLSHHRHPGKPLYQPRANHDAQQHKSTSSRKHKCAGFQQAINANPERMRAEQTRGACQNQRMCNKAADTCGPKTPLRTTIARQGAARQSRQAPEGEEGIRGFGGGLTGARAHLPSIHGQEQRKRRPYDVLDDRAGCPKSRSLYAFTRRLRDRGANGHVADLGGPEGRCDAPPDAGSPSGAPCHPEARAQPLRASPRGCRGGRSVERPGNVHTVLQVNLNVYPLAWGRPIAKGKCEN